MSDDEASKEPGLGTQTALRQKHRSAQISDVRIFFIFFKALFSLLYFQIRGSKHNWFWYTVL